MHNLIFPPHIREIDKGLDQPLDLEAHTMLNTYIYIYHAETFSKVFMQNRLYKENLSHVIILSNKWENERGKKKIKKKKQQ